MANKLFGLFASRKRTIILVALAAVLAAWSFTWSKTVQQAVPPCKFCSHVQVSHNPVVMSASLADPLDWAIGKVLDAAWGWLTGGGQAVPPNGNSSSCGNPNQGGAGCGFAGGGGGGF